MTRYIIWNKDIDETFRNHYPSITGEAVQAKPQETVVGKWCVGSGRITADQCVQLINELGDAVEISNSVPDMKDIEVNE